MAELAKTCLFCTEAGILCSEVVGPYYCDTTGLDVKSWKDIYLHAWWTNRGCYERFFEERGITLCQGDDRASKKDVSGELDL
jgi:hypothetical protein